MNKYELLLKYYETINNNFNVSLEKIHNLNKFEKYINNTLYDYIFIDYLNKMKYKINDLRLNKEDKEDEIEEEKIKKITTRTNKTQI
jgi:hypothetical protein